MAIDRKIICPLMQCQCIEDGALMNDELQACRFWVHLYGQDPQTGEKRDVWDCAFAWLPVLMTENSARQRDTAAEMEKLRQEIVPQSRAMTGFVAQLMGMVTPPVHGKLGDGT